MPIDSSVLLQATQPQLPNPLDLATKGLTLGNLSTQNQIGQMNLQGQQQYNNIISNLIQSNWSPEAIQQAAQQGPMGIARALQEYKAQKLTEAQITEAEAKGTQARAGAYKDYMAPIANIAAQISSQDGPIALMQKQQFAANMQHLYKAAGYQPQDMPFIPDANASDEIWKPYAASVGTAALTPLQGAEKKKVEATTGPEAAKLTADALKANVEASWVGYQAQSGRTSANAAASQAATHAADVFTPTVQIGPDGMPMSVNRFAQGGPQVGTVTGPGGSPAPQMKLTTSQEDLNKGFATEITKQTPTLQKSADLQQQVIRLQALDQQGIYNGPLGASKLWKDVTGVLAPMMTPEDRAKVENSQAFNAEANTLVGQYMAQIMGARMSKGALIFGQGSKPSDAMQPGARAMLWSNMYNGAQRNIDYWNQAANYAANPANITKGPGGFAPQYGPDVPVPGGPGPRSTVAPAQTGRFTVIDPNGKPHPFDTESQALEFKVKAGML